MTEGDPETDPSNAADWRRRGAALVAGGALDEARRCFERVLDLAPDDVAALNNLAVVLQRLGRLNAAEACYRRLGDGMPEIMLNHAALLGQMGRYQDALALVERVLPQRPADTGIRLLAADLERDLGRNASALARVERVLLSVPDRVDVLLRRATLLGRLERWTESLDDCERILASEPDHPEAQRIRALALQGLDQIEAALEGFKAAERASPAPAPIMADRARLLAEIGQSNAAAALLGAALALSPDLASLWYSRAALVHYRPGDPDLAAMERRLAVPDLPDRDRLLLCFALGKAYLEMGEGAPAFARLDEGNRLQRANIDYAIEADAARFAAIVARYSTDLMGRAAAMPATGPIFVFGMPRSGTTLVEQILGSHPKLACVGESRALADLVEAPAFSDPDPVGIAAIGYAYRTRIAGLVPSGRRSVDKMPANFIQAGLIALALPDARMIHCRRDPLDTCLSCYALLFTAGQEFAYDQTELGRFYRLYQALMAHWHRVLPPGRLLDLDYEVLVRDPETEIRRILDFCGLDWDPACLRFHASRRRVTTASVDQVRRPLFTTSIGRAQAFRPWLGPLEAALAGA